MKIYKNYIINKLNNYDWSDEQILIIKDYILKSVYPIFKTNAQKNRFIEKYKDFIIENNKLIFKPLNLEVIANNNIEITLKQFYDDYKTIGTGKVGFYKKIKDKYINITRQECGEFLSKQAPYQINTEQKHVTNKPILASSCGERFAIDLISVENIKEYNKNYTSILTCIDYFSRKVWARPLKSKETQPVLSAIDSICQEAEIYPHIIQADNGGEFKNYILLDWYKTKKIKPIFTLPYAPESNGLIENFNKQLRKMMREIFIRNNNLKWVDYLQICCDNKNSQFNRTTKHSANDLWHKDSFYNVVKNKTRELPLSLAVGISPEEMRIQARENIKKKAREQIERTEIEEMNVGDHVRIKMSSIYSEIRKQVKAGNKKLINIGYTPEIYRIFKVLKEDHPTYERKRYTLKKLDGSPLLTERKINEMTHSHRYKRLFASDLLKIDKNSENVNYDNNRGNQLNQIEKLVSEPKPKETKEKKKPEAIQEQPPQEIRKSGRERKSNKKDDYEY